MQNSSGRKNIMLGTAGHVDHGKTALVKLLTGCDTDTLAEEKQRGLTIDLGFAPCRLADERIVGVVDVPGHVDFIRNMVAGAHGIDVVILVVAADDGIMPQTHEHLHILTLMGLRHGLVALTKIDLAEAGRREAVVADLRRLLAGTFLEQAPICPVSNVTGEGFDQFFDALNEVVGACQDRPCAGCFRVWVEDVFTIRGSGTVVTGIASSGVVRTGDRLTLLPSGHSGRVRRLQVYGEDAQVGRAGECVALNLPELDHGEIERGMVLCESEAIPAVTMAEGELQILPSIQGAVDDYLEAQLHVGTASLSARVAMLETGSMSAGQRQMVQLRLGRPLAVVPGERFVIRANLPSSGQSGLTTIGGGRVLGVSNVRLRRQKAWTLRLLETRRAAMDDPARWCELMLRESSQPLSSADLGRLCLSHDQEVEALLAPLRAQGLVRPTPRGTMVHGVAVQEAAAGVLTAVAAFHTANPLRAGLGREELLAQVKVHPDVFELAVQTLVETGQLECNGPAYSQPGWSAQLSDPDQRLCREIGEAFRQAGWAGPAPADLALKLGEPVGRVEKMIHLLQERGQLVRLEEGVFIHRDAVDSARAVALRLFARAPSFSTMDFRDALGVSRKYAVPLLDHLDRVRFTVRSGHNRTPGVEARKQMKPPG